MSTTPVERFAAVALVLEGLALFVLAGWEVVALVTGDTDSVSSSTALIVLTAIGAVALVAFGAAVWRGGSWGRSGGIVAQLLALAVAVGALSGENPQPAFALAVAAPAIAVLAALVASARAAGRRLRAAEAAGSDVEE
ncbi:histidine kinase [Microbacterium sp. LjRoot45]|uniref:histidine kinase n=1 Tax=Microbacterium sp. LjRoot45 TaxID=3342329 RepID=UPI003ED12A14